jgi:hypothetical protein
MLPFSMITRYTLATGTNAALPAPASILGQAVRNLVTPRPLNDTFYPFSFQYIFHPSFPLCVNRSPLIPFPFIPLQAIPSPTGGYTPPPLPRALSAKGSSSSTALSPICSISRPPSHFSSIAYKMLLPQLLCFDNHPFSWGVYSPSRLPRARRGTEGCKFRRGGRLSHFVLESAALEHLQRATIQGSQPRGDTGRIKDCLCTGCGTIARTETIERKRRS